MIKEDNKTLDFLIIGAQKSGTTTLFKLLTEHPGIYMPPGKEVPFFTDDHAFNRGLASFLHEFYRNAPRNALWGKATPHYLHDFRAPERIAKTLPNVKLIAILRNPAERALSHYRMSVRRGLESRCFEDAVLEQLRADSLEVARRLPAGKDSEKNTYIVWGEYGRMLQRYFALFKREQILVLFTENLDKEPESVIRQLCEFLKIPVVPLRSLGRRFHEGGVREHFRWVRRTANVSWIRNLWHKVPNRYRNPLTYWFHQFNTVKEKDDLCNYSLPIVQQLREHFETDAELIEQLTLQRVPWKHDKK